MRNYGALMEELRKKAQRPLLEVLIEDKIYQRILEKLKQEAADKGYTQDWLKQEITQLNKEYLALVENALMDYNNRINTAQIQYDKVKATSFEHNYSPTDYADLQFLQTLIKSRILSESQRQPILVQRILEDYIHTQKGARAVTFLANDNEVGELIKPYYSKAFENAQSASEKRFNASKDAELGKLWGVITKMTQTAIVGGAAVAAAKERVTADTIERADRIYFVSEEQVI